MKQRKGKGRTCSCENLQLKDFTVGRTYCLATTWTIIQWSFRNRRKNNGEIIWWCLFRRTQKSEQKMNDSTRIIHNEKKTKENLIENNWKNRYWLFIRIRRRIKRQEQEEFLSYIGTFNLRPIKKNCLVYWRLGSIIIEPCSEVTN